MKGVLAVAIVIPLALILAWIGGSHLASPSFVFVLIADTAMIGAWLSRRQRIANSPKKLPVSNGWQGQSRGTATTLLGVGTVTLIGGFFYDAANPPNQYGLLFFSIAAVCLGLGIHRNVRVVRAFFGARWGVPINVLQFVLPLMAFTLDYAAELVSDQSTKWLLRFISVIPFVVLYVAVWIPLSRFKEPPPVPDEATIGRLG